MVTNEYMNNYMKNRWKERREEAILRLGSVCAMCGSDNNLEFDHVYPNTKSFTIASGSSFSDERFWREVDKCQLLCYRCHKLKHMSPHGTLARYRDCRCSLCKKAMSDYNRQRKYPAVV